MEHRSLAKFTNQKDSELRIDVEPWGDQLLLQPGQKINIVVTAPTQGELEVQIQENIITLFGWPGSVIHVFRDGIEV